MTMCFQHTPNNGSYYITMTFNSELSFGNGRTNPLKIHLQEYNLVLQFLPNDSNTVNILFLPLKNR